MEFYVTLKKNVWEVLGVTTLSKRDYIYWQCNESSDNEVGVTIFSPKEISVTDENFEFAKQEADRLATELLQCNERESEKQKEYNSISTGTATDSKKKEKIESDLKRIRSEKLDLESKYRKALAKEKSIESKLENYALVKDLEFRVTRLKDIYTMMEGIIINVYKNGEENGQVVTDITNVREDVYKLERFGTCMEPKYFDELAKGIRREYPTMKVCERICIDNDVPKKVVEGFAQICFENIMNPQEGEEGYQKIESTFYDVPVAVFKKWYDESFARRYPIVHIKEAFQIYDITKCNPGRNDYTVSAKDGKPSGKVIRFYANKVEGV